MSASRAAVAFAVVAALVAGGAARTVGAQEASREDLARELAGLLLDESTQRGLEEQVGLSLIRVIGGSLQTRLNRRLQEAEIKTLIDIVRNFVSQTLTRERIVAIGGRVYSNHFDDAEIRELLRFQSSPVGRKAGRLTPVIGMETAQAVEAEIQQSAAIPRLMAGLQEAFPVLRSQESP